MRGHLRHESSTGGNAKEVIEGDTTGGSTEPVPELSHWSTSFNAYLNSWMRTWRLWLHCIMDESRTVHPALPSRVPIGGLESRSSC